MSEPGVVLNPFAHRVGSYKGMAALCGSSLCERTSRSSAKPVRPRSGLLRRYGGTLWELTLWANRGRHYPDRLYLIAFTWSPLPDRLYLIAFTSRTNW